LEGHRRIIEECFETAKNEFGLDHDETRSWHGWHRHVSLVMLAFAILAAIRRQINEWLEVETIESKKRIARTKTKKPSSFGGQSKKNQRVTRRLTQRQIEPTSIIAWSYWRRAFQAAAREAHSKSR
jgi:hypothetical protein